MHAMKVGQMLGQVPHGGDQIVVGLSHPDAQIRLNAAMAAGTTPDNALVAALVERCAEEPDFFVRETLTWALARHPADEVLPLLRQELDANNPQARSQALHTLSKIA